MEETNPYLALRAAKIARNEARLKELGLVRPTPSPRAVKVQVIHERRSKKAKETTSVTMETTPLLRRSTRYSNRPTSYMELPEPKRRKPSDEQAQDKDKKRATGTPESEEVAVKTYPAHSARAMDIHVENLVLKGLLGAMMERPGKAFVMEEASRRSGLDVNNISFNKYSGVQEWKNDALFLWVNLGNQGDVVNDFLDGGRQITWFGGSRMHDETNVIRRLIRVGKAVASGTNNASDGLVLWCRSYDVIVKRFTPYVCLGRLSYHSHEAVSRPIKFVWNLMDYDLLVNHKDENVRSTFQQFVSL